MRIGPFRELLLLGGSQLLCGIAQWAVRIGLTVRVLTSPRHAAEVWDGVSLQERLEALPIKYAVVDKLENGVLEEFVPRGHETVSLSLGAAWIFSERLIRDHFRNNLFNIHGTRLPQYRGGGGFSWQILTGNRFGFCTVHKVEPGIDEGSIVFCKEFLYPAYCRTPREFGEVYERKVLEYLLPFLETMVRQELEVEPISQPEYLSSYWPRLNTELNGWIDWRWPAATLERFICAFDDPYPGAQSLWNEQVVSLKKASLNLQDGHFHAFQAGLVYRRTSQWLCVAATAGALVIEEVQTQAGEDLKSIIRVGDRFHTPTKYLERAKGRVSYGPRGITEG
jgi:methionyl-tRNA formyltransferase